MNWIDPYLADALSAALLHSLWQGLVIAGVIFFITKSGIFRNERYYYAIYLSGIFITLITSITTFFYFYDAQPLIAPPVAEAHGEISLFYSVIHPSNSTQWTAILAGIWSIGAMVFLLRILIGYFKIFQVVNNASSASRIWKERLEDLVKKIGINEQIILKTTTKSAVPFIWGFSKPAIIIPIMYFTRLNPREIDGILLHELAHIKKYDFVINFLQLVTESLFFYHPAIWWLGYHTRMQREFRCDALVSKHTKDLSSYLHALYQAAQICVSTPNTKVALLNNKSQLTMRIRRLTSKNPGNNPGNPALSLFLLFFFAFSCFAFSNIWSSPKQVELESLDLLPQKTFDVEKLDTDLSMAHWIPNTFRNSDNLPNLHASSENSKIQTNFEETRSSDLQIIDTVPDEKKINYLEQQLKIREQDLAKMEQKMQETLTLKLEASHLQLEKMAKELELAHQELEGDDDHHRRMEALARAEEKLAGKMEEMNHSMEKEFESGVLRQHALEIEKKAIEIEELKLEGALDEIKEKEKELQKMNLELRKMRIELKQKQHELMNNPAIIKAKEDLQKQQKMLRDEQHSKMDKLGSETREMQMRMKELQKKMQLNIEDTRKEMSEVHQGVVDEIRELKEKLEKEKGNQ